MFQEPLFRKGVVPGNWFKLVIDLNVYRNILFEIVYIVWRHFVLGLLWLMMIINGNVTYQTVLVIQTTPCISL